MIYYIKTPSTWVRVDYPCYGILTEMHELTASCWEGDLDYWCHNINEWVQFTHQGWGDGDYDYLPGLKPDDIEAIYTVNCYPEEGGVPDHPIFQHITNVTAEGEGIPDTEGYDHFFKLTMSTVPCDSLFIPMFMLRNIFSDAGDADVELYRGFRGQGKSHIHSVILANIWYQTSRGGIRADGTWCSEKVFYTYSEDGSMFSNCKVGDVVSLMKGGEANFMSTDWGDLRRGYPSYGSGDGSSYEPTNQHTCERHHMSHCMIVQRVYTDEFLNTYLNNNGSYFSEEELNDFIKEIMKHVEGT